jgi:hypothetical protein
LAAHLPVGRFRRYAATLVAYVLPAAITWLVIGAILNAAPIARGAAIALILYGLFYGIAELADVSGLWIPGLRWQVPGAFVTKRSSWRILVVWGGLLGPGFATRNPYAGFTAVLLGIATFGSVKIGAALAVAAGVAHGAARALALLRDTKEIDRLDYLQSVLRSLYWRRFDGLMLLLLAGLSLAGLLVR